MSSVFPTRSDTNRTTTTEDGQRLEILDLESRVVVAKTKALISYVINALLICSYVFAYAKSRFSHDTAHMKSRSMAPGHSGCLRTLLGTITMQGSTLRAFNAIEN